MLSFPYRFNHLCGYKRKQNNILDKKNNLWYNTGKELRENSFLFPVKENKITEVYDVRRI